MYIKINLTQSDKIKISAKFQQILIKNKLIWANPSWAELVSAFNVMIRWHTCPHLNTWRLLTFPGEKNQVWICKSLFISARSLIMATTVAFEVSLVAFATFCDAVTSTITFKNTLTSTNTFQPCGWSQTYLLVHWNILNIHNFFPMWVGTGFCYTTGLKHPICT